MSAPEPELDGSDVVLLCRRVRVTKDDRTSVALVWPSTFGEGFEFAGSAEELGKFKPGAYYRLRFFETEKPAEEPETPAA